MGELAWVGRLALVPDYMTRYTRVDVHAKVKSYSLTEYMASHTQCEKKERLWLNNCAHDYTVWYLWSAYR